MRRMLTAGILGAAMLAAAGAAGAGEKVSIDLPQDLRPFAPGPGVDVVQRDCAACHAPDYVIMQPRGDAKQWEGVVTKMRKVFGANISDADAKTIVEYLTTHYGPGK